MCTTQGGTGGGGGRTGGSVCIRWFGLHTLVRFARFGLRIGFGRFASAAWNWFPGSVRAVRLRWTVRTIQHEPGSGLRFRFGFAGFLINTLAAQVSQLLRAQGLQSQNPIQQTSTSLPNGDTDPSATTDNLYNWNQHWDQQSWNWQRGQDWYSGWHSW